MRTPIPTVIDLKDASIKQQSELILSNVNMSIFQGEMAYLVGRTGSGKSSLLKTLYADIPLGGGSATVAGFDLNNISHKQIPFLRRKLGIIFQDFNLLTDRNVEENLAFVLRATGWTGEVSMKEHIYDILNKVGLRHKGLEMPHRLSGGEQQRVVIARALINRPDIVIADEPTGNLDPDTADEVLYLLRTIAHEQQTAILVATHDYNLIAKFPARVIRCHNAQVIHEDNP